MKARWQRWTYLRYVNDEACNNVKSCKMTMMPPFRLAKIVNEDEQHGRAHHQPLNLALHDQNEGSCKTSTRKRNATWQKGQRIISKQFT